MKFGDALNQVTTTNSIRRERWPHLSEVFLGLDKDEKRMLKRRLPSGNIKGSWSPTQEDLFAEDWEIVE